MKDVDYILINQNLLISPEDFVDNQVDNKVISDNNSYSN